MVTRTDNVKTKAPNTTGSNNLYNTLELLMMGIMVPETCWASNKICNKNHLLQLFGILFPKSIRNISWSGKGSRCVGLTTLPPSCTDCHEIWEPQPAGTLGVCDSMMFMYDLWWQSCTGIVLLSLLLLEDRGEEGRRKRGEEEDVCYWQRFNLIVFTWSLTR